MKSIEVVAAIIKKIISSLLPKEDMANLKVAGNFQVEKSKKVNLKNKL